VAVNFDPKKYWNDRLSKHYDLIGVGDISLTMNYNKWSYKVTRHILNKLIRKHSHPSDGKILDIGSGTGFVIEIWSNYKNKEISGIDISSEAVKNLKQKFPKYQFYEIDAGSEMLPFQENSIQTATAASVLYHVVEDDALKKLLKNVHRVLQNNGVFIFSDNFIHQSNYSITHQKCRTLENYEELLRESGFVIAGRVPNYILFNDPVDAKGKFYPRLWSLLTRLSKKWKWFDAVIWPLLYPLEILLTNFKKESPAQEFMICRAVK
jgi:ubiquinone/menaquinone biosynthesis C-methylase UbiE